MHVLYHVSRGYGKKNKTFTPRVPSIGIIGECFETKRFCVSDSIENCFAAIPGTVDFEKELTEGNNKFCLYEFKVPNDIVKTPNDLFDHLVPDCLHTREHWIMEEVTSTSFTNFTLIDIESENKMTQQGANDFTKRCIKSITIQLESGQIVKTY